MREALKPSVYFRPILPWNLRGKYHGGPASKRWLVPVLRPGTGYPNTSHGFAHYMQVNYRLVL